MVLKSSSAINGELGCMVVRGEIPPLVIGSCFIYINMNLKTPVYSVPTVADLSVNKDFFGRVGNLHNRLFHNLPRGCNNILTLGSQEYPGCLKVNR